MHSKWDYEENISLCVCSFWKHSPQMCVLSPPRFAMVFKAYWVWQWSEGFWQILKIWLNKFPLKISPQTLKCTSGGVGHPTSGRGGKCANTITGHALPASRASCTTAALVCFLHCTIFSALQGFFGSYERFRFARQQRRRQLDQVLQFCSPFFLWKKKLPICC